VTDGVGLLLACTVACAAVPSHCGGAHVLHVCLGAAGCICLPFPDCGDWAEMGGAYDAPTAHADWLARNTSWVCEK